MRNPFIPIILFLLSGATYFSFIAPFWKDVGDIKGAQVNAKETIVQGEELKTLVADISEKVKQFDEQDPSGRIGAILPLEVDEILFLNDLSALVGNQGLEAKELTLEENDKDAGAQPQTTGEEGASVVSGNTHVNRTVSFSVSATYPQFVALLRGIEQNLVLLEIDGVEFTSAESAEESAVVASGTTAVAVGKSNSTIDYSVTLRTISVR